MKTILERIKNGEILVSDGAMGTMLIERGLQSGKPPESLNLTNPEILEDIARLYLDAGADIIQTNTFGASPLKLAENGLQQQTEAIIESAVNAVRKVVGDRAYVLGSCGPTGRLLKPYGDTDAETIFESFVRQITALVNASVDIVCIETMSDIHEAMLAVKAAKDVSPNTPVIATMTFSATPRGFFTIMGNDIKQAIQSLHEAGADIVGSNCGNGIENMVTIASEIRRFTKLPIIIQSNAGLPEIKKGRLFYPESPEFMASKVPALIASGVSIIGGCCGTTPAHIRAIRKAVASMS